MTKEIKWDSLTPTEAQTLKELKMNGTEIYAIPIKNKYKEQQETLGTTWDEYHTSYIETEKIIVHFAPADKDAYQFLLDKLHTRHCKDYRCKKCQIPEWNKPLIMCSKCDRCSEYLYPKCCSKHNANIIHLDGLIEAGYNGESDIRMTEQFQARLEYEEIHSSINIESPIITQVFEMKEQDGYSIFNFEILISLIIAVMASVISHLICKWLDNNKK